LNKKVVLFAIGNILLVLSVCLAVPLGVSLLDSEPSRTSELYGFGTSMGLCALVGAFLRRLFRRPEGSFGHTEGFAVVSLGWTAVAVFGCLPFVLCGACPSFVDALFETMSGFTTTGATILTDVEVLPRGLLFWRSFAQWLGGMGIVLLSVAILPALGAGGTQLFKAEVPGISGERLTPRIAETAKVLWQVYVLLTALEVLLLLLGGLDVFDAVCHTFATMSTGGFSPYNDSIGQFESSFVHWVVILFMFLAGVNFVLHFHALRGSFGNLTRNMELRFYLLLLVAVILLLTAFLSFASGSDFAGGARPAAYDDVATVVRDSAFQAVSIVTTTGFVTADFDRWPDLSRFLLLVLMFVGGCSGSTAGSMKVGRVMILAKYGLREVRRLVRPHAVFHVRQEEEVVESTLLDNVVGFCVLFFLFFVAGTLLLLVIEHALGGETREIDLVTAASAVAATLGNIGPGLGGVGATENYAWLTDVSKGLLTFLMILGRLELYAVLVLFAPRMWRR